MTLLHVFRGSTPPEVDGWYRAAVSADPRVDVTVSVIVATNRGGPLLGAALDSLVGQSFRDWELILVDDGSDDQEAVRRSVDAVPNAQVVRQENSGVSVARNVGFAHSSGEFVVYLDDDDLWDRERLALQVEALRGEPSAGCCHSGYWWIDRDGARFGDPVSVGPASEESYLSGEVDIPTINTLMVRRQVVQRLGGFLSGLALAEDCEFILRVVREGPVVSLPQQLVGWRRYPESVSFTRGADALNAAALHAVTIALWGAESRNAQREVVLLTRNLERCQRRFAEQHANEFLHLVRQHHWKRAVGELGQGLRNSPSATIHRFGEVVRRH